MNLPGTGNFVVVADIQSAMALSGLCPTSVMLCSPIRHHDSSAAEKLVTRVPGGQTIVFAVSLGAGSTNLAWHIFMIYRKVIDICKAKKCKVVIWIVRYHMQSRGAWKRMYQAYKALKTYSKLFVEQEFVGSEWVRREAAILVISKVCPMQQSFPDNLGETSRQLLLSELSWREVPVHRQPHRRGEGEQEPRRSSN